MTAKLTTVCVTFLALAGTPASAWTHHATATQFDIERTIKLTGIVSRLDWANPHVHISLDVKANGGTEHWDIELASPGGIIVAGLSRELLNPGTTISVSGYPARTNAAENPSNSLGLCARQLTVANGSTATFVVGI